MRHTVAHARLCTRQKHWRRAEKSTPFLIKKASRCAADRRLKQQHSLSFTFCKTQRSYEKIMCIYLLFHWFSGENCIIRSSDWRCSIQKGDLKVRKIHRKIQVPESFLINLQAPRCLSLSP